MLKYAEMRTGQYELLPEFQDTSAPFPTIQSIDTTPLFKVEYTPKNKTKANVYGVCGIDEKDGVERYALRRLVKDGSRMLKPGHPLGGTFKVAAAKCKRIAA